VIIVDNSAETGTAKNIVNKFNNLKKRVTVYEEEENLFYTISINKIVKQHFGEVNCSKFCILNPDCYPLEKDWLTKFLNIWDIISSKHVNLSTLGSLHFKDWQKEELRHAGCVFKNLNLRKFPSDWEHLTRIPNDYATIEICGEIRKIWSVQGNTGTGIIVDYLKFKELGCFDEVHYPHYSSDSDFCRKSLELGFEHLCCDIEFYHKSRESSLLVN